MSRQAPSRSPSPPSKRPRMEQTNAEAGPSAGPWTRTPVNYGKGMHLAPMVRSGTLPTRLLSLEAGAELVWGPETVDRAVIGCERTVDPRTSVISYGKGGKPIFTIHPVERSRLIFQLGSSNPELAAQAAKIVCDDVAGIDLNCGCPKHFSVHAGMGAGLLKNPDNLCAILKAIRAVVPPEMPVSCKIRMLPSQEDTLALVRQIVDTGAIKCLTVHCRTPPMRDREPAMIHRLGDIVEAVGAKVTVVENGDCTGYTSAEKIRQETGVTACMIARAAESNPTCFSPDGPKDAETYLIPRYVRLAKYLDNGWPNTRFCLTQFTSSHPVVGKEGRAKWKAAIGSAHSYEELRLLWEKEPDFFEGGEEILKEIERSLAARDREAVPAVTTSASAVEEVGRPERTERPMLDVLASAPQPTQEIQAVV